MGRSAGSCPSLGCCRSLSFARSRVRCGFALSLASGRDSRSPTALASRESIISTAGSRFSVPRI